MSLNVSKSIWAAISENFWWDVSAGVARVTTATVKCSGPGAVHKICVCSQTKEGESHLRVSAQHLCEPQAGLSIKLLALLSVCVFTAVFILDT